MEQVQHPVALDHHVRIVEQMLGVDRTVLITSPRCSLACPFTHASIARRRNRHGPGRFLMPHVLGLIVGCRNM
jgi:hypothetical protein